MGDLIPGDDGLPADVVGSWSRTKHKLLCDYITISRAGCGRCGLIKRAIDARDISYNALQWVVGEINAIG